MHEYRPDALSPNILSGVESVINGTHLSIGGDAMKRPMFLFSVLMLFLVPLAVQASPIMYEAEGSGTLWALDGGFREISGTMVISDEIHILNGDANYCSYDILSFDLNVDGYVFASTNDPSYMLFERDGEQIGPRYMYLSGSGDWTDWTLGPRFFYSDGTPYGVAAIDWTMLAPTMTLNNGFRSNGFNEDFNLTLTRVAPVPEPSTAFLLASGLMGLVAFRKRAKL